MAGNRAVAVKTFSMDWGRSIRKRSWGGSQRYCSSPSREEAVCEEGRRREHGRHSNKSLPPHVHLVLFSTDENNADPSPQQRCIKLDASPTESSSSYLLQAVLGTTVIPLCGPGEMENCTTALIQTENSPRVAQVGITRCKPEMKDYCFHGQCVYIVDLDEHYCRCDVGFSGVRCVHSELVRQPLSKEYVALTVIVVLLFLTAISIASYYICRRYRNKKRQSNTSEYKEVGAL